MKPRQKHVDILPADSKGWGACRGSSRIQQGTGRGWGRVSPCLVSCFGQDMVGTQAFPDRSQSRPAWEPPQRPIPGAHGQLSVLVGTAAVTFLASVWPWEACPLASPPKTTQQHTDTLATRFSPRPGRAGGVPGEKLRLACPKGCPGGRWPGLSSSVPRDPRGGDAGPGLARANSGPRPGGAGQGQGRG